MAMLVCLCCFSHTTAHSAAAGSISSSSSSSSIQWSSIAPHCQIQWLLSVAGAGGISLSTRWVPLSGIYRIPIDRHLAPRHQMRHTHTHTCLQYVIKPDCPSARLAFNQCICDNHSSLADTPGNQQLFAIHFDRLQHQSLLWTSEIMKSQTSRFRLAAM